MNRIVKQILWPIVWLKRKREDWLRKNNPEKLFSIWHKQSTGELLNIDNPKTLDEKIAYMAFRTDTSEWTRLADKVRVRDYVKECGYGDYLPRLYGTWERAEDIDFSKLPTAFVIKTNNGSATNILVRDKSQLNEEEVRNQLDTWMKIDYGYLTCQPHYSRIKPLILAEEYLGIEESGLKNNRIMKSLFDYKFYCINGVPMYVIVYTDRVPNSHDMKRTIYDMDWNMHQEFLGKYAVSGPEIEKPDNFETMKEMASKLSSRFPFVRVDFYNLKGKPIFGEMTFTPGMQEVSNIFSEKLGVLMDDTYKLNKLK